jgi:hypothetical protein
MCTAAASTATTAVTVQEANGFALSLLLLLILLLLCIQGGCIRLEGVNDAENFTIVGKAFDTIGMSKDLQDQVLYTLLVHHHYTSSTHYDAASCADCSELHCSSRCQSQHMWV